ncbi:MAG: hypothetical protein WB755_26990 [Terriglobales bacterium]
MANTIKKSHLSKEHDASSKNASVAKVTGTDCMGARVRRSG